MSTEIKMPGDSIIQSNRDETQTPTLSKNAVSRSVSQFDEPETPIDRRKKLLDNRAVTDGGVQVMCVPIFNVI